MVDVVRVCSEVLIRISVVGLMISEAVVKLAPNGEHGAE